MTLQNRHGVDYTVRLPEIVDGAKKIPGTFVLDGEVICIENGKESFTPCQRRCSTQIPDPYLRFTYPVVFMAFDILRLGEEDLTDKPYWKRKEILRDLVGDNPTIRFVPYRRDLRKAWEKVVAEGREGLILKDFNSRYVEGERSWSWLKVKNFRTEECEVVGWTDGKGSRAGAFGSLILAKDGRFRGCVGSGFSYYELMKIMEELRSSPAVPKPFPETTVGEPYHAVKPGMRVLVKYYETTPSGVMRHPVFLKRL